MVYFQVYQSVETRFVVKDGGVLVIPEFYNKKKASNGLYFYIRNYVEATIQYSETINLKLKTHI